MIDIVSIRKEIIDWLDDFDMAMKRDIEKVKSPVNEELKQKFIEFQDQVKEVLEIHEEGGCDLPIDKLKDIERRAPRIKRHSFGNMDVPFKRQPPFHELVWQYTEAIKKRDNA